MARGALLALVRDLLSAASLDEISLKMAKIAAFCYNSTY